MLQKLRWHAQGTDSVDSALRWTSLSWLAAIIGGVYLPPLFAKRDFPRALTPRSLHSRHGEQTVINEGEFDRPAEAPTSALANWAAFFQGPLRSLGKLQHIPAAV
jgi:hypothetical protein